MPNNSERYRVVYLDGEIGQHPHIIDTEEGGIVRFGEGGLESAQVISFSLILRKLKKQSNY